MVIFIRRADSFREKAMTRFLPANPKPRFCQIRKKVEYLKLRKMHSALRIGSEMHKISFENQDGHVFKSWTKKESSQRKAIFSSKLNRPKPVQIRWFLKQEVHWEKLFLDWLGAVGNQV